MKNQTEAKVFKDKIIKIGVVSDTHIPISASSLPKKLLEGLKGVNLIIHAGDIVTASCLREIEEIAPVCAIYGNMDSLELRNTLPHKREIKVSHFKIGIVHGSGQPSDLPLRMRKEFNGADIIIFGHSHLPFKQIINGVLMFNPGSPTDKVFTAINSYGILELNNKIKARHVKI